MPDPNAPEKRTTIQEDYERYANLCPHQDQDDDAEDEYKEIAKASHDGR